MGVALSFTDQLKTTSITSLSVGDTRFRRALFAAGYKTLISAFDAPSGEIDRKVGFDEADTLDRLKAQYEADPERFAEKALHKEQPIERGTDSTYSVSPTSSSKVTTRLDDPVKAEQVQKSVNDVSRTVNRGMAHTFSMPKEPFGEKLLEFEPRVRKAFDELADRNPVYLAFEAFEDFATELDELDDAFLCLFKRFKNSQGTALSIATEHVPNAFILFCADQARSLYDGKNFWDRFFEKLGLTAQNRQIEFKRALLACLRKRGMPTYSSTEKDFYYLYTALLHGGLSNDSWENLWKNSLLPMARKALKDPYGFGTELNAQVALQYMRDTTIEFSPGKFVLGILDKAPDATILPIIDAALQVALKMENGRMHTTGVTMLTSSGLPDTALNALASLKAKKTTSRGANRAGGITQANDSLVYLPESSLLLNLAKGQVVIRWKGQVLPESFVGYRVDFYVNGECVRSEEIAQGVGRGVLESGESPVGLFSRYDVTIKLKHEADGVWIEDGSLEQSFVRRKPGCLEFIQLHGSEYRLRDRKDRISHVRQVAFVLNNDFAVVPGSGMRQIEVHEGLENLPGISIALFQVAPGAIGSIIRKSTRDIVTTWQEDVNASINRGNAIGKTAEGLDVYPVIQSKLNWNLALPIVTIESADGSSIASDLEAVCESRGRTIRLRPGSVSESEDGTIVSFFPGRELFFPWNTSRCAMTITRKSTHSVVFRYSFAIIPIRDFIIKQINLSSMIATYDFSAMIPIEVIEDGIPTRIDSNGTYHIAAPLSDETIDLCFVSDDERVVGGEVRTEVILNLAGIDIEITEELRDASEHGAISLGDVRELGTPAGAISITSKGSRKTRCIYLSMGQKPLLFRRLEKPGRNETNIFVDKSFFMPADGEAPRSLPLTLTVFFGKYCSGARGYADMDLMDCYEGFGFCNTKIYVLKESHVFSTGVPVPCDLGAEVCWAERERVTQSFTFSKGEMVKEIPARLLQKVDERRDLIIRYFPLTLFGDPEREFTVKMPFKR